MKGSTSWLDPLVLMWGQAWLIGVMEKHPNVSLFPYSPGRFSLPSSSEGFSPF